MTWFERRLADLEAHKQRQALIKSHAPTIYEAIWREIIEHVKEARTHGWHVDTNGEPRKRAVMIDKQNKSGVWRLDFILGEVKDGIRAKGDHGINLHFDLDVCDDGVVCLRLDGSRITLEDAATAILDPFLFPQLQKASN